MAIYRCEECQEFIDDDYHPGEEHPSGLVCPACVVEAEEEINSEDYRKPKVPFNRGQSFSKSQREFIKKCEAELQEWGE